MNSSRLISASLATSSIELRRRSEIDQAIVRARRLALFHSWLISPGGIFYFWDLRVKQEQKIGSINQESDLAKDFIRFSSLARFHWRSKAICIWSVLFFMITRLMALAVEITNFEQASCKRWWWWWFFEPVLTPPFVLCNYNSAAIFTCCHCSKRIFCSLGFYFCFFQVFFFMFFLFFLFFFVFFFFVVK